MNVNNAKELHAVLDGRNDREITSIVTQLGVEETLDKVFAGMTRAFLPEQAAGEKAVIQWNVDVDRSTHVYQLSIANGKCKALKGARATRHLTLATDLPTFLRVITGRIDSRWAVFTGKLKVDGNILFARTQEAWFDKNWAG